MRFSLATQAALAGIEAGVNRTLQLDPSALARLGALQGRVIAIECTAPALTVFVLPAADGLHLASHHEADVDCRLIAPLNALVRLATARDKTAVLHEPGVTLEGDSGPLMALSEILEGLDLDWEHELSRGLGPLASGFVGQFVRTARGWTRQSANSLHKDVADYLTEEARTLVGRREAEARFEELDAIKLTLDRLDARMQRLSRTLEERPKPE
ncbi:ubiquinone biosynthesis accessory factor UbiJ [Pseudomonas sp. Marseille-QA0892]